MRKNNALFPKDNCCHMPKTMNDCSCHIQNLHYKMKFVIIIFNMLQNLLPMLLIFIMIYTVFSTPIFDRSWTCSVLKICTTFYWNLPFNKLYTHVFHTKVKTQIIKSWRIDRVG